MNRAIRQIVVAAHTREDHSFDTVYALANDGSLWRLDSADNVTNTAPEDYVWSRLPDLPAE